ncbi:hypothetical protein EMIT0P228_40354 [Pseudomonas brassicacearum]
MTIVNILIITVNTLTITAEPSPLCIARRQA